MYDNFNDDFNRNFMHSGLEHPFNTRKYDRGLSQFRRSKLHWLDVDDLVRFMACVHVLKSAQHGAWIPVVTLPTGV